MVGKNLNKTEREDNLTEQHRNGRNKRKITIESIESENKLSAYVFQDYFFPGDNC